MNIKIINDRLKRFGLPQRKKKWDAWYDVRSLDRVRLKPWKRYKFPLWFAIEIPEGYVWLINWRSWLAVNYGIDTIWNVIDSWYRWEISAILVNTWEEFLDVYPWDRIAQLIITPCFTEEIKIVSELTDTERGQDWFWSTGI